MLLAEALDLARLALALDDRPTASLAFSEAVAFAVAAAVSAQTEPCEILAAIANPGGKAQPIMIAPGTPFPAGTWRDALAAALITGNDDAWSALTADRLVAGLALGAHPVIAGANASCRSSGLLLIGIAAGDSAIDIRFEDARRNAATADERAFVDRAQEVWRKQTAGWPQRVEDALAAWHRERAGITTPSASFPLHWAALAVLAARLGAVSDVRAARAPDWLGPSLTEGLVSAVSVRFPLRSIRHPLEPHWWLELEGLAGSGREHRIEPGANGRLLAWYRAGSGLPDVEATFELCGPGERPSAPWALDAGELLLVADRHARQVAAEPAADADQRRQQREHLSQAAAALDLLLAQAEGAAAVPPTAFRSARGLAVRDAEPGRFDTERLRAVRGAYQRLLGEIERGAPDAQARTREREAAAREDALAAIAAVKAQLEPLVRALSADRTGEILRAVRPRPDDYAKAFQGPLAAAAAQAFARVWAEPLSLLHPRPEQTQLLLDVAPAGMLASDNELSHRFPGGYRKLAPHLVPNRVWARWKLVRPGDTIGMAYDGLVWLDDHWAWFPKPYRVLADCLGDTHQ